ncbi:MAG: hypothetical protein OSJ38_12535, partial [Lachnospiraceae bacterium]|nr:hypothetical protein [Lachnospiraceae bacterium]
ISQSNLFVYIFINLTLPPPQSFLSIHNMDYNLLHQPTRLPERKEERTGGRKNHLAMQAAPIWRIFRNPAILFLKDRV